MNQADLFSRAENDKNDVTPTAKNPFHAFDIYNGDGKKLRLSQIFSGEKQKEINKYFLDNKHGPLAYVDLKGEGGEGSVTLQEGGSESIRVDESSDRLGFAPGTSDAGAQSPGILAAPPVSPGRHEPVLISMLSGSGRVCPKMRATTLTGKVGLTSETTQDSGGTPPTTRPLGGAGGG